MQRTKANPKDGIRRGDSTSCGRRRGSRAMTSDETKTRSPFVSQRQRETLLKQDISLFTNSRLLKGNGLENLDVF